MQDPTEADPLTADIQHITQVGAKVWAKQGLLGLVGRHIRAPLSQATFYLGLPRHSHSEKRG